MDFFLFSTIPLILNSRGRITENHNKHVLLCEEATRADLARRVRHDIRSPLGALQIGIRNLAGLDPVQQEIIYRATDRIKEIVSELELVRILPANQKMNAAPERSFPQSILTIVQDIIQEKRTQLTFKKEIQIVPQFCNDSFFLFADIRGSEFKRALSNIIDNAIEACGSEGRITVKVGNEVDKVLVEIEDTGKGIKELDLPRVTDKGFTNKRYGSGLGLYYAKIAAEESGGSLAINSQEGVGTTVAVRLPACTRPEWYVPAINVPMNGTVVILDDQESTHLSWKMRLDELRAQGAHFSVAAFKTPRELLAWHRADGEISGQAIYLLDYDLGVGQKTGLDVAHELSLGANAILVTGHFDSEDIQRRCTEQRIGLLPKSYLSLIQLQAV